VVAEEKHILKSLTSKHGKNSVLFFVKDIKNKQIERLYYIIKNISYFSNRGLLPLF
jgi:hypothetical protein